MTIKPTLRNAVYSTDPTASDVGRFLGRRNAAPTSERHEPVMSTRVRTLEELYPSLFAEPRFPTLRDAATAAADVVTAVFTLLRRCVIRSHPSCERIPRRIN